MAHERLNAFLASLIPLIPLLFQRGAQDFDWGGIVSYSKPFVPKYLPPPPSLELLKDEALVNLHHRAFYANSVFASRWLLDAISQPLKTSFPVADSLGALRSHFRMNAATSSLLLSVVGLLFLALVFFLYPADIHTSSLDTIPSSNKTLAQVPSANAYPTFALAPEEFAKPESVYDWRGAINDPFPLPPFGIVLSTRFPLTPITEEEEVQDTSPHSQDEAQSIGMELLVSSSSSCHVPSPLSSQSPNHTVILPSVSDVPLTPLYPAGEDVGEQCYISFGDHTDVSLTSVDFVLTVFPPSTSDLDLDPPTSCPDQVREAFLTSRVSYAPSIPSSTETAPSTRLLPSPSFGQLSDLAPVEDREEACGSGTSPEGTDGAETSDVLVCETPAVPALREEPRSGTEEPDQPPSPARSRALSNITEVTEPSDSSGSSPGTLSTEWLSDIHEHLASLDLHGLTLQETQRVADVGTTASTPEVSGESHWSLVDVPSTMEDFLPLSTSSPSLHLIVDCPPENADDFHPGDATLQAREALCPEVPGSLDRTLDGVGDAATAEPPASLIVGPGPTGCIEPDAPSLRSSGAYIDLTEDDENGGLLNNTTALPPLATVVDVSLEVQRSPPQVIAVDDVDQAAPETFSSIVSSSLVAQSCVGTVSPVDVCLPAAPPEVPDIPTLPATELTVTTCSHSQPQTPTLVATDRPTPSITTCARRASKILVSRTGIAGQQVSLTETGLAQLVARLDKPLPLEDDVRGERRRMERVTNCALAEHSADRGELRDEEDLVVSEPAYVNAPISPRVERNVIDAAHHGPLKDDPYIRIPVCEVGRSRSSSNARPTTNVVLVKKPSASTSSSKVVSAVAAGPLLLPRNWDHRRAQSETVDRSPVLAVGDENRRQSYAAVAAKGVSSQSSPRAVNPKAATPKSPARPVVNRTVKSAKIQPVEVRLRTTSAPASSTPRFGEADDDLGGWRKGNRWSALVAPTVAELLMSNGKGKKRPLEYSSMYDRERSPEKGWSQSRLPQTPTRASSTGAGKASGSKTTWPPLLSIGKEKEKENGSVSPDSGANGMRGSLLSAKSRVKLRDLALSAQQTTVSPRLVSASSSPFNFGSVSGTSSGSRAVPSSSGSGSSSAESGTAVCPGAACVPAPSAQAGLVVADEARGKRLPQADLPEASADPLATSRAIQACSDGILPLESVLRLPDRSTTGMHSSTVDESADLVIASQDCRPPSPSGVNPAVVRLNANATSNPTAPPFSFGLGSPTIPVVNWGPTQLVPRVPVRPYRPSVVAPSRHEFDFAVEDFPVLKMPARTQPLPLPTWTESGERSIHPF